MDLVLGCGVLCRCLNVGPKVRTYLPLEAPYVCRGGGIGGDGVLSGSGRSRKKVVQIRDDRAALSLRLEQLMSRALSLETALPIIPAWETSPGKLSLSKWK